MDRHWSFARKGLLDPGLIRRTVERHHAADRIQYVELIYAFEDTDEYVYQDVLETMMLLQGTLGDAEGPGVRSSARAQDKASA
jgi:hypothetical protein